MVPVARHYTPSEWEGRITNAPRSFPSCYSVGSLIVPISGVASGTDGRFWFYYVNEMSGHLAASEYETSAGDRNEWLFAE